MNSKQATPTVLAVGQIDLTGNIIPHNWYTNLKRDSGKPHATAVILLAEIVYWYRPTEIRDEATGQVVEIRRKFKADKLQRSYGSFSEQFGFTKRQVKDALKFLARKGIIDLEFRHFTSASGTPLSNVLFIGLDADALSKITHQRNPSDKRTVDGSHSKVTPVTQKGDTYTDTTTEITTDTKDIDAPSAQPLPFFPKQFTLPVSKIKERKFKRSEWEIILEAEKTRPDKPPRATLVKWLESKLNGSSHPAIQAYREEMGSYPRKNQFQDIIDTVGEKGGAELFKQIVHVWKMSGWNPLNIGGMLECYERGEIPKNGKQKSTTGPLSGRPHRAPSQGSNGTSRTPELSPEPTPDELAAELAAAAEHHLLQQQSAANG